MESLTKTDAAKLSPGAQVYVPTGRLSGAWLTRDSEAESAYEDLWEFPGSSLPAFSWCFSEEQGGSREDILNFHALRNPRPRGPALAAAT